MKHKPCSAKIRFTSIIGALDMVIGAPRGLGLRGIYKCECGGWHTTSQPRRSASTALGDALIQGVLSGALLVVGDGGSTGSMLVRHGTGRR